MTALDRVTDALRQAGSDQRLGGNWNCPGPSHSNGDAHASLHVAYNGTGVALTCHTGCSFEDIMTAIDLKPSEAFDEPLQKKEPTYYPYQNADGEILFAKLRYYEPKRFSIKHPL